MNISTKQECNIYCIACRSRLQHIKRLEEENKKLRKEIQGLQQLLVETKIKNTTMHELFMNTHA